MIRLALALAVLLPAAHPRAQAPAPPASGDDADYSARIRETTSGYTVRSTLGPSDTPLPLELSNFLLDHPDLAASIVRAHRIAPYRIEMRGPRQSWADDGDGTQGLVTLVERGENERLYYGEGVHRGLLFPPIRAAAVIAMGLRAEDGADGCPRTKTTFTVYVRMRSRFVSGVVKALRPFLQKTVVGKFSKAFFVADQVGRLMAKDPDAVAADVRAFPALSQDERARLLALMSRLGGRGGSCRPPPSR